MKKVIISAFFFLLSFSFVLYSATYNAPDGHIIVAESGLDSFPGRADLNNSVIYINPAGEFLGASLNFYGAVGWCYEITNGGRSITIGMVQNPSGSNNGIHDITIEETD